VAVGEAEKDRTLYGTGWILPKQQLQAAYLFQKKISSASTLAREQN
jgi:hypothetical protein